MYLLTGLFSAASAFLFATSGFYDGPGGSSSAIATSIVTWIVAFVWLFIKIGRLEEKSKSSN